jgi:hypothetical protein
VFTPTTEVGADFGILGDPNSPFEMVDFTGDAVLVTSPDQRAKVAWRQLESERQFAAGQGGEILDRQTRQSEP